MVVGVSTSLADFYGGKTVLPPLRPWFRGCLSFRLNESLGQWLREEETETLLDMAQTVGKSIADSDSINPELADLGPLILLPEAVVLSVGPPTIFDLLELPNPPWGWGLVINPHFWVHHGLPAIKAETERRQRRLAPTRSGPLGILKQLDVQDVAGKYTVLQPAGSGRLKGKCPFHEERTPSFVVYLDSNRWQCFGACATGGDVVNLIQRLARKDGVAL